MTQMLIEIYLLTSKRFNSRRAQLSRRLCKNLRYTWYSCIFFPSINADTMCWEMKFLFSSQILMTSFHIYITTHVLVSPLKNFRSINSFPFAHLLSKKNLSIMIRKCLKTRWCWPSICVNIFQSSLPNNKLCGLLVDIPLKFVQWISWCISRNTFMWNVEYSETLWERCWVKYRISIKHLQMRLKTIYNHNHNYKVKFKQNWKPGHQYYI